MSMLGMAAIALAVGTLYFAWAIWFLTRESKRGDE